MALIILFEMNYHDCYLVSIINKQKLAITFYQELIMHTTVYVTESWKTSLISTF